LLLGGLQKLSLIDYPGKLSSVVFTLGCNFRCSFCHNPELVVPELINQQPQMKLADFFKWLQTRQGKLQAVVVTGGEPTLHQDLPEFLDHIKHLGFLVKLDTNGSSPAVLKQLLRHDLIDYIAMDIKSSPERYSQACGLVKVDLPAIHQSVDLIKNSGVAYCFRTTVAPKVVSGKDVEQIRHWLGTEGTKLVLQEFRPEKTLEHFTGVKTP